MEPCVLSIRYPQLEIEASGDYYAQYRQHHHMQTGTQHAMPRIGHAPIKVCKPPPHQWIRWEHARNVPCVAIKYLPDDAHHRQP